MRRGGEGREKEEEKKRKQKEEEDKSVLTHTSKPQAGTLQRWLSAPLSLV